MSNKAKLRELIQARKNTDTGLETTLFQVLAQLEILREEVDNSLPEASQIVEEAKGEINTLVEQIFERRKGESRVIEIKHGKRGERGEKGEKGERGDKGEPGRDGKDGKQGKQGNPGKDGSPDTPQQIADKLNTTEESVSFKVIKGLENKLNNLSSRISKVRARGGGGMGDVQHETFNISSSTTSIQTAHSIAAGGNAIMNFVYENANLEISNHYTVGTDRRTITFNTDVQSQLIDNTVASITYVRG